MPQGSVLSPALYILYTNNLLNTGLGCLVTMYADYITQVIATSSKSRNMMKMKAEREIERINRYEKNVENRKKRGKV